MSTLILRSGELEVTIDVADPVEVDGRAIHVTSDSEITVICPYEGYGFKCHGALFRFEVQKQERPKRSRLKRWLFQ